jgi:hypothetical protein
MVQPAAHATISARARFRLFRGESDRRRGNEGLSADRARATRALFRTAGPATIAGMAKRKATNERNAPEATPPGASGEPAARGLDGARGTRPSETRRPSALVDTRVVYCGDNLEQLRKLSDACVDLIYIDPPFNSNRNYEVFWGETKEKRAFEDRHASTQAYIDFMRPRCVELARVLKKTGSFYYHCDWHASHYVKVMSD